MAIFLYGDCQCRNTDENKRKLPRLSGLHNTNHCHQWDIKVFKPIDKNTNIQLRVNINTVYEIRTCKSMKKTKETKRGAKKLLPKTFNRGAIMAGFKGPYSTKEMGGSLLILYSGFPSESMIA
jgi:hypothetical protein